MLMLINQSELILKRRKPKSLKTDKKPKSYSKRRLTLSQRKDKIRQKMASFQKKVSAKTN